jgi:hypothetical protein
MSFSIFHNTKNDRQYKAATGLDCEQFDKLFILFDPYYTPKSPSGVAYSNAPVLTNKREALFFILHYLKAYPTLHNMGIYFGMSDFAVSTYIELLKPCLKAALQAQPVGGSTIFQDQKTFDRYFEGVEDLVIDVTEIPIERAVNQKVQERRFSGKKSFTRSRP